MSPTIVCSSGLEGFGRLMCLRTNSAGRQPTAWLDEVRGPTNTALVYAAWRTTTMAGINNECVAAVLINKSCEGCDLGYLLCM